MIGRNGVADEGEVDVGEGGSVGEEVAGEDEGAGACGEEAGAGGEVGGAGEGEVREAGEVADVGVGGGGVGGGEGEEVGEEFCRGGLSCWMLYKRGAFDIPASLAARSSTLTLMSSCATVLLFNPFASFRNCSTRSTAASNRCRAISMSSSSI